MRVKAGGGFLSAKNNMGVIFFGIIYDNDVCIVLIMKIILIRTPENNHRE